MDTSISPPSYSSVTQESLLHVILARAATGCDLKDRSDPENGQIKEDKDGKHTISGVQRRTI